MHLRLVFLIILLSAQAVNTFFAKNGHAQHGAPASAANSGASGKGANGAKPPANTANPFIDAGEAVPPPVLPSRGQEMRTRNPSVKIVIPVNPSRGQTAASPGPARNAIGQFVSSPRIFVGPQPAVSSALPRPGAGSSPIIHGVVSGSVASVVPSGTARVTLANAPNRGSINGASAIHPATAPSIIGGPAAARYGINGTTVQQKH